MFVGPPFPRSHSDFVPFTNDTTNGFVVAAGGFGRQIAPVDRDKSSFSVTLCWLSAKGRIRVTSKDDARRSPKPRCFSTPAAVRLIPTVEVDMAVLLVLKRSHYVLNTVNTWATNNAVGGCLLLALADRK